ncbi:MAG: DNA repair protein RecO (recombination protein O) [Verrucomicrobiales bacterium]|jgi:DNA repair protein RecO (recombination protein O)
MEKTTATLIRTSLLTETSLIVHWCSGERGLFKTVAKGARSPRSPFAGKLDIFFEAELVFVPSRVSDLHTLREVEILHTRKMIRRTWLATLAASHFIRWIEIVAERETPIPELADLLVRGLNYLDEKPPNAKAVRHFEKQLAQLTGVYGAERETEPAMDLAESFGAAPKNRDQLFLKIS